MTGTPSPSAHETRRWRMGGRVQGVGYRAFVFRLAQRLKLTGFVQNLAGEVLIEAQGTPASLDAFAAGLAAQAPPLARPHVVSCEVRPWSRFHGFEVLPSDDATAPSVHVPPDSFLCDDCRRELLERGDRRHRYAFINCTQCGPRYTLITRMPYDRPNTTMAGFPLCPACRAEYEDPHNRRFHAQPLACAACGPRLTFTGQHVHAEGDAALHAGIAALHRGEIVAVKGVGGYHLICDAANADAIARMRARKPRPHKPLAVMFPWAGKDGLHRVREELHLDAAAARALTDAARPIVLVPRRAGPTLPDTLAPGLDEIGAVLPYSPLHHLLLADFGEPLVVTSGNIGGEPVLTDALDAQTRLAHIAQGFLHHDRPIARPADDSVLRVIAGRPRVLRAGRGIAPLELELPVELAHPTLAIGGHMKNAIALGWGRRAVLSPHIGDLDAPRSLDIFEQVIADLQRLYRVAAQRLVHDAHPGYASSRWAAQAGLPARSVHHHHAHASALAFEAGVPGTGLVFTWDGAGLGPDGTLWGGEALLGKPGAWRRVATLRPFRLPGGERASREPSRCAAALCWEAGLEWHGSDGDGSLLKSAWRTRTNSPSSTSAGRLFDAAASLLGLCDTASFEGQGPMLVEAAATRNPDHGTAEPVALPLSEGPDSLLVADWSPLLAMLRDTAAPAPLRAARFHASLARCISLIARRVHDTTPLAYVGLTGGVFQNKLLAELALERLKAAGFNALLPSQIPCNDGGLALGQLIEAAHQG